MKRVMIMLLSVACLVGCQGCGTTAAQKSRTVRVSVLADGKVAVNGRVFERDRLIKKVKAAGAKPLTAIEVSLPTGAPQTIMVDITRELRKAGYTKILFVRPRQAVTSR